MKSCACRPLPVGNHLPGITERGALIPEDSTAVISPEQTSPERPAAMPEAQVIGDMECTPARPDLLFALEVGHWSWERSARARILAPIDL